jgi:3-deoxy-D-manno-octulosonic-acid transferase
MRTRLAVYNALLPAAALAARAAAPFNAKIAEGLKGREGFKNRWREKSAALDRKGRLIWFHVSSVGEFEQAKPVMELLARNAGPSLELALTFFSPSGMNFYERFDRSKRIPAIRFVEYLPVDTAGNMRFCLDTLGPDMIVYVKFDIWPNIVIEAARRGIPQVLVSGTLSPGSRRLSSIAKSFYGGLYSKLDAVAAISAEDAGRFRALSSGSVEIVEAGDTRFDQVCRRIDASGVKLPGSIASAGRTWIVAGSTWPRDEAVVIPGFAALNRAHPDAGLIIVPHEPTPERLDAIGEALGGARLPFRMLSGLKDDSRLAEPVVVADGVGYLAELYRAGAIAYVGGSFTTGVHNVMEPAVLKLPVFFGPRIDNSFEARELVRLEAAAVLGTASDFEREIGDLLSDRKRLETKGDAAANFIRNHCGAALRCVDLIEKYLNGKGKR